MNNMTRRERHNSHRAMAIVLNRCACQYILLYNLSYLYRTTSAVPQLRNIRFNNLSMRFVAGISNALGIPIIRILLYTDMITRAWRFDLGRGRRGVMIIN